MKTKTKSFLLAISFLLTVAANAQVTIGSDIVPNAGSLLELKENNMAGTNSTKGLGLPRVEISDLTKLKLGTATEITNPSAKKSHAGLTVFNTKEVEGVCVGERYVGEIATGIYVWSGTQWEPFWIKSDRDVRKITYSGTNMFTLSYADEAETYYYASFGAAGTWMTQSLRTRYAPNGTLLVNTPTAAAQYKYSFSYPSDTDPTNPARYNAKREMGLLYDWYTATASRNCSKTNQGQTVGFGTNEVEAREANRRIKGICPDGWHLPSDREWNELEKELTVNADKYATPATPYTTDQKTWKTEWETTFAWRGSIAGSVMMSKTLVPGATDATTGDSKSAANGGFDVYLVGYINPSGGIGDYHNTCSIWSSSAVDENNIWYRFVSRLFPYPNHALVVRKYMFSIRCKKD